MITENVKVVVPWHNPDQKKQFLDAWSLEGDEPFLVLQQDFAKEGCARTKNAGVERAVFEGADVVIVLDDDCYPAHGSIDEFIHHHVRELNKTHEIPLFKAVTQPASRGTPYRNRSVRLPAAACMGFWIKVGDYDAPSQLVYGAENPMTFDKSPIFGQFFPLCGMNLSFKPKLWDPWWNFIDVSRFDDIWQGFLWQKFAYTQGYCFSLSGPEVLHSRQSNVWANLKDEALHLEANETLWQKIFEAPLDTPYEVLRSFLPV